MSKAAAMAAYPFKKPFTSTSIIDELCLNLPNGCTGGEHRGGGC
jgi:hypothetical protein